jgi:hypothetical protein
MKRTCKLLVVAMAVSALSIAGLKAGWSSQREQPSPASNDPAAFSLTVENGKPSGSFKAWPASGACAHAGAGLDRG